MLEGVPQLLKERCFVILMNIQFLMVTLKYNFLTLGGRTVKHHCLLETNARKSEATEWEIRSSFSIQINEGMEMHSVHCFLSPLQREYNGKQLLPSPQLEDELNNAIERTAWVFNSLTGELTVRSTVEITLFVALWMTLDQQCS